MVRHGCRAALVAALCFLIAAPSAFAAEELGDAGDLPLTAQEAGPAGPLTEISGEVAESNDRDMYKVCLTAGTDFSASTVGTTGFDTQLFLFNELGTGVYANDDAVGTQRLQSTLPAGNTLGPHAAGVYYLAVTAFNWDPQSLLGPIFPSSSGLVGPIGRGGALPISSWAANDQRPGGSYNIVLTGTRSCIDATPPTVDLRTPPDGAEYAQNEQVIADYDCADEADGSGLDSCVGDVADGAAVDTSTLGEHTFTVTARDRRGNETVVTHTYTVVDRTEPTVDLRTPPDGAVYAQGEDVVADYDCADEAGGSGLASCTGDVADGAALDTAALGAHSFTVTAVDGAGNTTTVTHNYRVADRTAPTIDLRTPPEGAVYARGEQVLADFDCADEAGGSGIHTCQGSAPDGSPIDTSQLGPHTFMVVALDRGREPHRGQPHVHGRGPRGADDRPAHAVERCDLRARRRDRRGLRLRGRLEPRHLRWHRARRRADRHGHARRPHLHGQRRRRGRQHRHPQRHLPGRGPLQVRLRGLLLAGAQPAAGERGQGRRVRADPVQPRRLPGPRRDRRRLPALARDGVWLDGRA